MNPAPTADGPVLRDIHLPPSPSWWPPAPGWWVLALVALLALAWLLRRALRRRRERRWRKRVHAELERIAAEQHAHPDGARCAAEVSHLLRRVSRLIDPAAVALRDEAWLAFLDRQLPPSQAARAPFARGTGRALLHAPFRAPADPGFQGLDTRALLALARDWLRAALPHGRSHA
jgi:hypothetical protein